MSVRTHPGSTALTSTPSARQECARIRVNAFTAAFDTEYAGAYVDMVASPARTRRNIDNTAIAGTHHPGHKRAADFNHTEHVRLDGSPSAIPYCCSPASNSAKTCSAVSERDGPIRLFSPRPLRGAGPRPTRQQAAPWMTRRGPGKPPASSQRRFRSRSYPAVGRRPWSRAGLRAGVAAMRTRRAPGHST